MDTGLIIKKLRCSKSLSQQELAEELHVARSYLSQIENGRKNASIDFLRRSADFFKVPVSLLIAWEYKGNVESDIYLELKKLFADLLAARISSLRDTK